MALPFLQKISHYVRNPFSVVGLFLAFVSAVVGLPMLFFELFSSQVNPYAGILVYLILPGIAFLGVMMAILGIVWQFHRRKKRPDLPLPSLPKFDFENPRHQAGALLTIGLAIVIVVLLSVTGYKSYQFTDSVEFCGLTCHSVMKPEHTAYLNSPHARVACAACHIGPGAGWFVRSKLSGSYQVYSVIFKKYHRPIETPIRNLRPAQEVCEQCHWPSKFFGAQQKTFLHRKADEKNSPWEIVSLIKVGGGDPLKGAAEGIHWHMNIEKKIYYYDSGGNRETIPYVKSVASNGTVTEYMSTEAPVAPEDLKKAKLRRMDCIDCHNRPSHIFYPPSQALDQAFEALKLDPSLPYLKREGMRLLAAEYNTEKEALKAIEEGLPIFYKTNYPSLSGDKKDSLNQAVQTLKQVYSSNLFPEMKADWRAHPTHVGHLYSDGCFRCHDGLHVSTDGRIITKDCTACHTILAQGEPDKISHLGLKSQPFQHPVDVGMDVTTMKCSICHTGTTGL